MKYKINCPVCGNEVEEVHYGSEHGTEEEYYGCNKCGYGYEFAYGNYKELINGVEYSYSYLSNKEDLGNMNTEFQKMKDKFKIDRI